MEIREDFEIKYSCKVYYAFMPIRGNHVAYEMKSAIWQGLVWLAEAIL